MTRYEVYLEHAADGPCMAHVPRLPGCAVRAPACSVALDLIRDAIVEYHAWLRRHGEPAPGPVEPIDLEVAGDTPGLGPFGPGDAAALFTPDREPLTNEEMETHFRLMAYSRADLLALAHPPSACSGPPLPDEILDWQAGTDAWSIRRVLRHVGNAEEWYVSRLVPPETLPAEWEDDEGLSTFEFLEMERRTALARLRQLSVQERADLFYPTAWTDHPDEAWTVRKALRRFLEHEREHTAQVAQILDAWRRSAVAEQADP